MMGTFVFLAYYGMKQGTAVNQKVFYRNTYVLGGNIDHEKRNRKYISVVSHAPCDRRSYGGRQAPNWLLAGHVGIIGHDHVMVSLASSHYTNKGIKENKKLSVNLVDEALLPEAGLLRLRQRQQGGQIHVV